MLVRSVVFAILSFIPSMALAQAQAMVTPDQQVTSQRIISLTGDAIQWQIKATELQREVDDLQKQLDALKKPLETPVK